MQQTNGAEHKGTNDFISCIKYFSKVYNRIGFAGLAYAHGCDHRTERLPH
jgi:hypothetical protein